MDNKLNECILVAGKKNGNYFISKNRDRSHVADLQIIQEIYQGIEIAYYKASTGWIEGMNEYGLASVYTYLMYHDSSYYKWRSKWSMEPRSRISKTKTLTKTSKSIKKREELKHILSFTNTQSAIEYIKTLGWNGSYYVGDPDGIYEIEHFMGQTEIKKVEFSKFQNFKIKTNNGELIKIAGHISGKGNTQSGVSSIRKKQAELNMQGYKSNLDVLRKMQQKVFDTKSNLNTFRNDDEEVTVNQSLFDLNDRIFYFVYDHKNANYFGVENNLPINYEPIIKVFCLNRNYFNDHGGYFKFKEKEFGLYNHFKNFNGD